VRFSQSNERWSRHKSGKRCWNWCNQSVKTLTMPLLKVHHSGDWANQGGVISLTTAKITRQHDLISFSRGTASRYILWGDGAWTSGEIEPAWENYHEPQEYKSIATCKEYGFRELCVLTSFRLPRFHPLLRPSHHHFAASNAPRQKAACTRMSA